jgi:hypothetical protein
MQIHEVTLARVNEGLLDLAKKAGSGLAQAGKGAAKAIAGTTVAKDLAGAVGGALDTASTVLNTPGAMTSARSYGAAIDQAERAQADKYMQQYQQQLPQQTQQHSKKLTQGWVNHMKASGINPAAAPTPRAAPGQMPANFAASAQGQKTLQAYGQPRGGIQGMQSDDLKEQTSPDTVKDEFVRWSDSQLTGRITGTRDQISMDNVRQDAAEKAKLEAILGRIAQKPDDAAAVEEYFTTAMQAMQRISAEKRASLGVSRGATAATGNEILPQYIPPTQLEDLKQLVKNPRVAAQIKRELGII